VNVDSTKILVVEDDTFLREIYIDTLKKEGYTVEAAVDGDEAYTKMKQNTWDIILLDILLPKMNGFEIVEKLRQDPTYTANNKCIIFLTNLDNEGDIKKALVLGSGYIIKSQVTPGDLIKEIKVYLQKSSSSTS